jgi:V-type H+-transporting ATPase subunit C
VVESVTHKVRRQIDDLERASNADSGGALSVEGVPIDSYITRYLRE